MNSLGQRVGLRDCYSHGLRVGLRECFSHGLRVGLLEINSRGQHEVLLEYYQRVRSRNYRTHFDLDVSWNGTFSFDQWNHFFVYDEAFLIYLNTSRSSKPSINGFIC